MPETSRNKLESQGPLRGAVWWAISNASKQSIFVYIKVDFAGEKQVGRKSKMRDAD